MHDRIIVIDIETTGLYPERGDRILEIAALPIVSERIALEEAFHRLVNPGAPIPPEATRIHRISDETVAAAPPIETVLPELLSYVGDCPLVAHNAPFDLGFLRHCASSLGIRGFTNRVIDTMELSRELFPFEKSHSLDSLLSRLAIPHSREDRHRSMGDAHLTALCFLAMKRML